MELATNVWNVERRAVVLDENYYSRLITLRFKKIGFMLSKNDVDGTTSFF